MIICKNCKHKFKGKYCNECGEKVVGTDDLRIGELLGQAFTSITDVDSKLLKTLKLLFFYPGELTKKYVQGIRVPFLKPFQLFLIANILFYLFLSNLDLFRTPSKWYFQENFDGINVLDQVREISKEKKISIKDVAILYDKRSSTLSKSLMLLLIPFMSFIAYILNFREKHKFGEHVIFSIHFFSFILFFIVIWTKFIGLFLTEFINWYFIIPITIVIYIYYILALKKFYQNKLIVSTLKGIIAVFLIMATIQFYRVFINILTMNTI